MRVFWTELQKVRRVRAEIETQGMDLVLTLSSHGVSFWPLPCLTVQTRQPATLQFKSSNLVSGRSTRVCLWSVDRETFVQKYSDSFFFCIGAWGKHRPLVAACRPNCQRRCPSHRHQGLFTTRGMGNDLQEELRVVRPGPD